MKPSAPTIPAGLNSAYIGLTNLNFRLFCKTGTFATVRFQIKAGAVVVSEKTGFASIKSGKIYSTEARMRSARSTRPADSVMIRVIARQRGAIFFEILP